jgi:hypothetical protein
MEKINTYTQEFLSSNFAQYLEKFDNVTVTDNLPTTRIPALQIPGLNLQLLKQIYCHCIEHPSEFQLNVASKSLNEWYNQPLSAGWYENTIIDNIGPIRLRSLHDQKKIIVRPDSAVSSDKKLIDMCTRVLEPLGVSIQFLRIMKLNAGGWIRPHQDFTDIDYGLCYFWIPLHEFPVCMKVFPFGWLQHQYGNMCLFNSGAYVHAVHNHTQQDRYVMIGRFDPAHVPESLLIYYNDKKHDFLNIWKN